MTDGGARTVVITGTSSGIGRACVRRLARAGFQVWAGVRTDADARALRAEDPAITPVRIDVTRPTDIGEAAQEVAGRLGPSGLGGLVNNAGIGLTGPMEHVSVDLLRRHFEVNVFGQLAVTQAFLPLIRKARGRIVNMGSVGDRITIPFGGALCASKSALRAINDALRLELGPFGIRVCLIEPASIYTPAAEKTLGDVEATVRGLGAEGAARYGQMLREFNHRAYERERKGSSPDVVARVVEHALTSAHPRAYYLVGKGSRILGAMPRLFPDWLLDRIRRRLFGIPRRVVGPEAA